MVNLGEKIVEEILCGEQPIEAAYLGTRQVWPTTELVPVWLTWDHVQKYIVDGEEYLSPEPTPSYRWEMQTYSAYTGKSTESVDGQQLYVYARSNRFYRARCYFSNTK